MFYNKTLLDAKSKIEKQFRQDKEKYEINKQKFYVNPIHWDNNKRKELDYIHLGVTVISTEIKSFDVLE